MLAGMGPVKLFLLRSSSVSAGSAAKSSVSRPPLRPASRSRSEVTRPAASQATPRQVQTGAARVQPDSAAASPSSRLAFHASSASVCDVAAVTDAGMAAAATKRTRKTTPAMRAGRRKTHDRADRHDVAISRWCRLQRCWSWSVNIL
ncbi:Os10g0468950 [Oryza sativa Japonica Group]|uniref:Os10g0468950 protein n=2 Tax=Oryza sativa subsp. japonica TaxID=39947 RepID=C7J7M4_ORYSJ|nr:hypothetical protein EE612_051761 [Oryza sativa]BAH94924.1 Os10g0468950 [Oryza sativa Japonica Group]BAT11239.1 Os10g0468950 [Oryza sativa Japonica Group]|eukprot:NP_001176196.1 Os10g0468950 [Oryza sativa Japonica Group]